MFNMKVEKQMNIKERTLLLGVPDFDKIPKTVSVNNRKFKVIGTSYGVKLPYISLEIENTNVDLTGQIISE